MAVQHGLKAEDYFYRFCESEGLNIKKINTWYDFEVEGVRVELKSCRLAVYTGKKESRKLSQGRYDFTKVYNREVQQQENIWVCFIIRAKDQFLIQGFVKSKELNGKRYISIVNAESYSLKSFNEFKRLISTQTKSL